MADFKPEIERLRLILARPSDSTTTEETVRKIDHLMRLDGWEPGGLAERVGALEASVETLKASLAAQEANTELLEASLAALEANFETLIQRIDAIEGSG